MDYKLRQLERAAASGDPEAVARYIRFKNMVVNLLPDVLRSVGIPAPGGLWDVLRHYYQMDGSVKVGMENFPAYRRVCFTELSNGVQISTVLLGINYSWSDNLLIFETMVFDQDDEAHCERYGTVEEARAGHNRIAKGYEHANQKERRNLSEASANEDTTRDAYGIQCGGDGDS